MDDPTDYKKNRDSISINTKFNNKKHINISWISKKSNVQLKKHVNIHNPKNNKYFDDDQNVQ